jgi:hypothetical protein
MTTPPAAGFAAVFIALYVAHLIGDHWVQTDHQAAHKGCDPHHGGTAHPHCNRWRSRALCALHVATYTATALAVLAPVAWRCGLDLDPVRVAAGLTISAVTHYVADRRRPLQRLANATGSRAFFTLGAPRPGHDDNPSLGTGAYALDQSWHVLWILAAALVMA